MVDDPGSGFSLEGRVAVVTGGGRGIGRAIATRFAAAGAIVVVSSRTEAELDSVVASMPTGLAVVADALDPDAARLPVVRAVEAFGAVDILVNNAGGIVGGPIDPFVPGYGSFEQTVTLNLTSAWWTANEALPHMRATGWGRIINIGSGASRRASGTVAYTAAKHGLVGLTSQLAQACGRTGITVNCILPGWTDTAMHDFDATARARGVTPHEVRARAHADSAQRRILDPTELTGMALLLASDEGRGITGQAIGVDGGYRL